MVLLMSLACLQNIEIDALLMLLSTVSYDSGKDL
jgi:hypothetical protein